MKKLLTMSAAFTLFGVYAQAQFKNEPQKVSYALGLDIARNVQGANIDSLDVEMMIEGLRDAMKGNPTKMTADETQQVISTYLGRKNQEKGALLQKKGQEFLAANAKRKGVITLPSGLQYEVIREGKGKKPTVSDQVTTHYTGTTIGGKVFDSSVQRNEPATFPVSGVIKGWTEALQLMPAGSKWKLYIPYNLAYGEQGVSEDIGPYETLIFELELLEVK